MTRTPLLLLVSLVFTAAAIPSVAQEVITPTTDSSVAQKWTSVYGYSFLLPNRARANKLLTSVDRSGETETANFILPGGGGAITIQRFKEGRMVPKDYRFLDSVHVYDVDSTGRNGVIHRRVYILDQEVVQIDVLLTAKGETEYGPGLPALLDSFVPPEGAEKRLAAWRYGRDPREFEHGKPPGSDDSR